jgi:hypothetical protein
LLAQDWLRNRQEFDAMAESFLKEQLERIRRMTESMSALESHVAELSDAMAHDRAAMRQGPLDEVRDYRLHPDASASASRRSHSPDTPEPRRSDVRESPRRRRRG